MRPHCLDLQTEGSDCDGWPAMAAVVGMDSAVPETKGRYEPDNGTFSVVRAQRFVENLTNGVKCQPYRWYVAKTRTEPNSSVRVNE